MGRSYTMTRRAEAMETTRQRIVEATVELHGTVGPAATTVAGIAERAGVTRVTVYHHFPDAEELFAACSAHWLSQQRPPDPGGWAAIAEPEERFRVGLADVYRFYHEGEQMLFRISRDIDAIPDSRRRGIEDSWRQHRDVLVAAFPADVRTTQLRAVIGHAVSFTTWRSLCTENGLPIRDAVSAMTRLVMAMAASDVEQPS
jgi:AcrR family transcriptional regulator